VLNYEPDMRRVVQKFDSFTDAEAAEVAYYRSLDPQERLNVLLDLVRCEKESGGEAAEGFARVCRIVEFSRS